MHCAPRRQQVAAAIVPGVADDKSAILIAQKFITVMQQPFIVGMHRFNVGVSIGIALYPQHGVDPMTLLRQSDVAMYQAKQSKSGYAFFDSVRDYHKLQLLTLERDLRQAIKNGSLELYYQPMVDIRTTKVSCVEALVRWRYPDLDLNVAGQVYPRRRAVRPDPAAHPLGVQSRGGAVRPVAPGGISVRRVRELVGDEPA